MPSLFRTRMGSIIIVVVAVAVSNIIVMVVVVVAIILILKLSFFNLQSACKFTLNLLFFSLANGVRGRLACPSGALTLVASWSE